MSTRTVLLLSGCNLDILGSREPEVYGSETLADHVATFTDGLGDGFVVEHVQSSHEGELIDAILGARGRCAGIAINPAAFSHYAWGLHDALAVFDGPVVEIHLSNPHAREGWRRLSVVSPVATAVICGLRGLGYRLAGQALRELLA